MRVKQINWSEHWKLKRNNFKKKSKCSQKCLPSSKKVWLNQETWWISWKNSMKPSKNCVSTLKWWKTWPLQKLKNSSTRKNSSIPKSSLTSRSPICQILTKIHNLAEESTTKLTRNTPESEKEDANRQTILKSEAWASERIMQSLPKLITSSTLNLWTLQHKPVMFTWTEITWPQRLKSSIWTEFLSEPAICSSPCFHQLSRGKKSMSALLIGTSLKMNCIWKRKPWKNKPMKSMRKSKEKSRKRMKQNWKKRKRHLLLYRKNLSKTKSKERKVFNRWKSKKWKCKRKSDRNRPKDCECKFKTKRKLSRTLKLSKNRKSSKNITSKRNCSKHYQNASNWTWLLKSSKETFQWAWKWCYLTLKDKTDKSTWRKDRLRSR